MISGTEIKNFTYLVGSNVVELAVPQYALIPKNANFNFQYTLGASTPGFVTLSALANSLSKLNVVTNNVSDTGIYSIDVTVTETYS